MKKIFICAVVALFSYHSFGAKINILCSNGAIIANYQVRDQQKDESKEAYAAYLRGIADTLCGCQNTGGCSVYMVPIAPNPEDNLEH